ncbi:MAG: FAD-binding protein [Lachnospiraceae bacterium]|nr:FAD-binding protein [Lachnospiraceae bacterium]
MIPVKTDILVIGGGLAGRRCAEEASKKCKVILISDGSGASPYVHGINVPLFAEDTVECFIEDTMRSGRYQNKKELVKVLCEESIRLTEEFSFDKKNGEYVLLQPLGAAYPRVAGIQGRTGVHVLNSINRDPKFTELHHVRAMRLICEKAKDAANKTDRSDAGRVTGAYCFDTVKKEWFLIEAKAVVLACGGFGGIFPFSTNSPDIGGEGIAMAYEAGARLLDMEFIQYEPSVAVWPPKLKGKSVITTMLYEGAVIRNGNGERFMDERVDKDVLSKIIYQEINSGKGTKNGGVYYDMTGVGAEMLHEKYEDYYRRYASVGIDISKEPVEIAPGPHTTMGGIEIDEKCCTNVQGLFACGEVTGGLHGANRLGGNAGLEILVFGKIAGKSAAEYAAAVKEVEWERCPTDEMNFDRTAFDDTSYRKLLEDALVKGLNVVRNESDMKSALAVMEQIMLATHDRKGCFTARRLYCDALTAYLALTAATTRKQSIGSHVRADESKENRRYRIILQNKNNHLQIEREYLE